MEQNTTSLNENITHLNNQADNKSNGIIIQLIEFWRNLGSNTPIEMAKISKWTKLWYTLQIQAIFAGGAFLTGIFVPILFSLIKYDESNHAISKVINNEEIPRLTLLLTAVIIGPFFEEVIFRLGLVKYRINFYISFAFFFLYLIMPKFILTPNINKETILLALSVLFNIIILLYNGRIIDRIYAKHSRLLYILSVLLFGLIHISNFTNANYLLYLLTPILILPQILLGFGLGFVRMKYGFIWSCILHSLHNGMLFIPSLLVPLNKEVKDYSTAEQINSIIGIAILGIYLLSCIGISIFTLLKYRKENYKKILA